MNNIKNILILIKKDNILQFVGFIILCLFVWVRFIKDRFPKEIPFNLSIFGLLLLLIICFFYLYNIYKIFKSININTNTSLSILLLIKTLIMPLVKLNDFFLEKKILIKTLKALLFVIFLLFKRNIYENNYNFIYAFIFIIPKIIVNFCFLLDCFYFKKLYLIYTCIIVLTLPLLIRYLLYVSEKIKTNDLDILNKYFIIEITSEDIVYQAKDYDEQGFILADVKTHYEDPSLIKDYCSHYDTYTKKEYKYLTLDLIIEYQACAIYFNHLLYDYKILFKDEREDVFILNPVQNQIMSTKTECENTIQFHIILVILNKYMNATSIYYKKHNIDFNQQLNLLLNFVTFSCWLYILIVSLHTLNIQDLMQLLTKSWLTLQDPFAQQYLFDYNDTYPYGKELVDKKYK